MPLCVSSPQLREWHVDLGTILDLCVVTAPSIASGGGSAAATAGSQRADSHVLLLHTAGPGTPPRVSRLLALTEEQVTPPPTMLPLLLLLLLLPLLLPLPLLLLLPLLLPLLLWLRMASMQGPV